jgi:phosphoribosyl 1,2-cyclic phosphodiesterase
MFVKCGESHLLIDAGISCRRVTKALKEINEDVLRLDAVFITHEHDDHIKGLPILLKKNPRLKVYASVGTIKETSRRLGIDFAHEAIEAGEPLELNDLLVEPFELSHDANEPTGYCFIHEGFKMALATDLGTATKTVAKALSGCRMLILEANHDEEMLKNGPYPWFLKKRIASKHGHLSNRQTRELLRRIDTDNLRHLVLAHLSAQNNTPQAALDEIGPVVEGMKGVTLQAASRETPGELLCFDSLGRRVESVMAQVALPW